MQSNYVSLERLLKIAERDSNGTFKFFKDSWISEDSDVEFILCGGDEIGILLKNSYCSEKKSFFHLKDTGIDVYIHEEGKRETLVSSSRAYRNPIFTRIAKNYQEIVENAIRQIQCGIELNDENNKEEFLEHISGLMITNTAKDVSKYFS